MTAATSPCRSASRAYSSRSAQRFETERIVAQRQESISLRIMLQLNGRYEPQYYLYDSLFSLN
jgi:hypothetical protein